MKFCPECGSPVQQGAKFCVSCGQPLGASEPASSREAAANRARIRIPPAFGVVFAIVVVAGIAVAAFLIRQHSKVEEQQASAKTSSELPAGHPQVELPKKARDFIANLESEAKSQPANITTWNRLGTVALRAALFDASYYKMAEHAYGHVLQLDPDNLEALRGIGNLNYDRQKYDEAIAAYEHYLKRKPDDPDVQTDLGTMYLYTGNADQAVKRYQKAISIKPGFFDAYFNMGVAYGALNDGAKARASLNEALKLAPDQDAKSRVNGLLAKLNGGARMASSGASSGAPAAAEGGAAGSPQAGAAPNSFQGQIESMVRGLPFAGPKVQSVRWDSKNKATVLMNDFPMDGMPPFARQKFVGDLTSGIEDAKKTYHFDGPFVLQIADAASGHVMETVSK